MPTIRYNSVADLCAAQPSEENADLWRATESEDRGADWLGVDTRAEVIRAVSEGWPEGVARMFEGIGQVAPKCATVRRKRRVRADFGDELDIHRVYRGSVSDAWSVSRRTSVESRNVVRIVMQIGALTYVQATEMFWRGAACAVLADALEAGGQRVEIFGYSSADRVFANKQGNITILFPIKAAESPLDPAALAATVCLAGFHRHYVFKARCSARRKISPSYGATAVGVPRELDEPGLIHVSLNDVSSQESAIEFVRRHVAIDD